MSTRSRWIAAASLLAVIAACDSGQDPMQPDPGDPDPQPPASAADTVWKGYGLSPVGFPASFDRLLDFFGDVGALPNGAVMQNGSWRDDALGGSDAGTFPAAHTVVFDNAATYGYAPIAVFGWRSGADNHLAMPGAPTNDWTNADARSAFIDLVVRFAGQYRPRWLFLGNESDFYYEEDPADYARWIDAYEEAYDAIHAVSPGTKVGPVFNYEHLAGTGDLNFWTDPNWPALEMHDLAKVDVVGLTLYPWFGYTQAGDVPSTYLDPLFARIGDIPLAVTETGWPAESSAGPFAWEADDTQATAYVAALDAMLDGRSLELVNWLFYNGIQVDAGSPTDQRVFGSVSVRDAAGAERPLYDAWMDWNPGS